ncbi:uncharacterized protein L203_105041 [Cryptococcus depauperatus CBS 7841]|uniref:Uncharacterized protein n=1 Tax=Cryptococcus depauperatus CBS 7841 TaxID=1295531 RepID=A0A1E3I1C8_9TREE|nr:hypothetical protein L203_05508 [Cryptococcus depauperatus CBS 7841]
MSNFSGPTPASIAAFVPVKRQSYVTVSVLASETPTAYGTNKKDSSFPIAIAIPALVGGVVVGLALFSLWWWWRKRSRRIKKQRWEEALMRKKKRAAAAAEKDKPSRPSTSSSRQNSDSPSKSPISEKFNTHHVLPPPSVAQPYYSASGPIPQGGYGYKYGNEYGYQLQPEVGHLQNAQHGYNQYGQPITQQPQYESNYAAAPAELSRTSMERNSSEEVMAPLASNGSLPGSSSSSIQSHSVSIPSPRRASPEEKDSVSNPPASTTKDPKKSRAGPRIAAAESAAANASVDPMYRHKPSKPSPLAIKAEQQKNPFFSGSENLDSSTDVGRSNVKSDEWGVALGSPDRDNAFSDSQAAVLDRAAKSDYSQDPYLSKRHQTQSGMYSQDPYASYHDEAKESKQHDVAESIGLDNTRSRNMKVNNRL